MEMMGCGRVREESEKRGFTAEARSTRRAEGEEREGVGLPAWFLWGS
jgi:hypothetical protein